MIEGKYGGLLIQVMLLVAFSIAITSSTIVIGTIANNTNTSYAAAYAAGIGGTSILVTYSSFLKPLALLVFLVWIVYLAYELKKVVDG